MIEMLSYACYFIRLDDEQANLYVDEIIKLLKEKEEKSDTTVE